MTEYQQTGQRFFCSRLLVQTASQVVIGCVLATVALTSALADESKKEKAPLVIGIHPYKSAGKLVESYKPLAAYLSDKTGRHITVKIAKDYGTHIQLIGEDKLDIAYLGPASYVTLVKQYGRKPLLARQAIHGSPTFQGKIVTRSGNRLRTLKNLRAKRFAFGDPASTMSHLVPRYMLRRAGVTVSRLKGHAFLGSHDNVALAVLAGDFDAGAVKEAVYRKYQSRGLASLATTPALSEHLFVTRTTLPHKLQHDLRTALLELKDDPQGAAIMGSIKSGMTAWVPVTDANYNNLRTILDALAKAGIKP